MYLLVDPGFLSPLNLYEASWFISPSGAGTNLKVGAPVRSKSGGHRWRLKIFLVVPLHLLALKVQLVVLVSAFVMVSTVWSVSCLLSFYTHGAPVPSHL